MCGAVVETFFLFIKILNISMQQVVQSQEHSIGFYAENCYSQATLTATLGK